MKSDSDKKICDYDVRLGTVIHKELRDWNGDYDRDTAFDCTLCLSSTGRGELVTSGRALTENSQRRVTDAIGHTPLPTVRLGWPRDATMDSGERSSVVRSQGCSSSWAQGSTVWVATGRTTRLSRLSLAALVPPRRKRYLGEKPWATVESCFQCVKYLCGSSGTHHTCPCWREINTFSNLGFVNHGGESKCTAREIGKQEAGLLVSVFLKRKTKGKM